MRTTVCRFVFVFMCLSILAVQGARPALAADSSLIVVRDLGGASTLPYYEAINLQRGATATQDTVPSLLITPMTRFGEADLLPVHSARLSAGKITRRAINAPGLRPVFLIGDDAKSRAWLREHREKLRAIRAVGFVVHVDSQQKLDSLRRLAPDLTLSPGSGDDLAQRLNLEHYPVLITATAIEQ